MPVLRQGHSLVRGYTPPSPHRAQGNRDGEGDKDRGNPRVGETPGKRVGAAERGRGRARGWHTRVTARLRQGGQRYRQGRRREGEWEGRRARERARGCGTGEARRRAGGTRRARRSSGEREHGDTKKTTTAEQADLQEGHVEVAGRGRWGEQGANKGAKDLNVSHRETPCRRPALSRTGRPARPSGS